MGTDRQSKVIDTHSWKRTLRPSAWAPLQRLMLLISAAAITSAAVLAVSEEFDDEARWAAVWQERINRPPPYPAPYLRLNETRPLGVKPFVDEDGNTGFYDVTCREKEDGTRERDEADRIQARLDAEFTRSLKEPTTAAPAPRSKGDDQREWALRDAGEQKRLAAPVLSYSRCALAVYYPNAWVFDHDEWRWRIIWPGLWVIRLLASALAAFFFLASYPAWARLRRWIIGTTPS